MIRVDHLRTKIIRPALEHLGMHSVAAENLVVGTALAESVVGNDTALVQLGGGPALGVFQMEPATYRDIWNNWIKYNESANIRLRSMVGPWRSKSVTDMPPAEELITNLAFAAAMCRIHYRRIRAALPAADDLDGMGDYYKQYYNTYLGKGSSAEFANRYKKWGRA